MPRLRLGTSIWLADDHPAQRTYPPLRRCVSADVVIVGGGFTGALAAFECATHGLSVAVLEAERVGRGSTAANTGLLMHEPDMHLGALVERYGLDRAVRIWRLCRNATSALIRLLQRLRIPCDLTARESLYISTSDALAARLWHEHRLRVTHRFRSRWLDADAARAQGVNATAALVTEGHAQLDPYRACRGLMAAAKRRGAQIFEGSPVTVIEHSRSGVRVRTAEGDVRAGHVVIATGYATPEYLPLTAAYALTHTYAMSSTSVPHARRALLTVPHALLWTTERPYHYLRWGPDHRVLVGGADRPLVPDSRRAEAFRQARGRLVRDLRALCPGLRHVTFDRAWEGLFAITPDGLPFIGPHPRYPHHLFALGYGGNGMTFAYLAARLLACRLAGKTVDDLKLFAFDRMGPT